MKIGIPGAAGRMGQALTRQVAASEDCTVVAATELPDHPSLDRDCGALAGIEPLGVAVSDDAQAMFRAADAVLDFTLPDATAGHAALAGAHGTVLVVGTTGLGQGEQAALEAAAAAGAGGSGAQYEPRRQPVAPTYRAGRRPARRRLRHRDRRDAPPPQDRRTVRHGLGPRAGGGARAAGYGLDEVAARGRDGVTGARARGEIGFAALRGGDVVGEHSVIFAAEGERLELTCRSGNRQTYARGAILAARWALGRQPGLYSMADVLGLG